MAIAIDGDGTITGISVGGLPDGIVDTDMIAANAVTAAKRGSGAVLQVVSTAKTDTFTASNVAVGSPTDLTGITSSITPSSASNKVLIQWNLNCGHNADTGHTYLFLLRGSTKICVADSASSRTPATQVINGSGTQSMTNWSGSFLDSPSTTSATTYKFQVSCTSTETTGFGLNRSCRDNDAANYDGRAASTFTLMEVAG